MFNSFAVIFRETIPPEEQEAGMACSPTWVFYQVIFSRVISSVVFYFIYESILKTVTALLPQSSWQSLVRISERSW